MSETDAAGDKSSGEPLETLEMVPAQQPPQRKKVHHKEAVQYGSPFLCYPMTALKPPVSPFAGETHEECVPLLPDALAAAGSCMASVTRRHALDVAPRPTRRREAFL